MPHVKQDGWSGTVGFLRKIQMSGHAHSRKRLPDKLFDAVTRLLNGSYIFNPQIWRPRQPPPAERILYLPAEFRPGSVSLIASSSVPDRSECRTSFTFQAIQKRRLLRLHVLGPKGTNGRLMVLCDSKASQQKERQSGPG